MKISVVMATYQGEKYLREQLDTIRLQTRRADEVILCDDCSGDATVEIAEQYIREYGLEAEWRILVNEKNLGYANNFHRAASLATGKYLFFADQDDLWKPEKIEKMVGVMEAHPDCMVLCTDYEPFYEEGKVSGAAKKALERMPDDGSLEKVELSERSVYIGALGCCMCVRGSFYRGIQDYWFDGWAQDDRMWRLSQCADGCYLWHSNLVRHRIHDGNTATYGKYHTVEKRVRLFTAMRDADAVMQKMLENTGKTEKSVIMEKHIRMMEHRIRVLKDKHFASCIPLLGYLRYYQNVKSYLVEICIALKSR